MLNPRMGRLADATTLERLALRTLQEELLKLLEKRGRIDPGGTLARTQVEGLPSFPHSPPHTQRI